MINKKVLPKLDINGHLEPSLILDYTGE